MDEEKIEGQEPIESVTTDVVTEDLGTAADELLGKVATEVEKVKEEVKEEGKIEVKTKEELELERHKEQSNLGRKVKKLEETLEGLSSKLDAYFTQTTTRRTEVEEPPEDEIITTRKDVRRVMEEEERRKIQTQTERAKKYETSYVQEVRKMSRDDDELGEELLKELFTKESPFNRYITGDPIADARINYAEASRATLKKKIATTKPKPNVKGEKSAISTNMTVTNRESSEGVGIPALDDFAREFVNKTKMSEDSVKSALGRK